MNASLPQPLKATITVHYKRGADERYEVLLESDAQGNAVGRLSSPWGGETRRVMRPRTERAHDTLATRALQSLVECFFGDVHAVPRIVGAPEWTQVVLELQALRERTRRMLLVELKTEAPHAALLTRSTAARGAEQDVVRLCPEDADPVYAVTRLALVGHAASVRERQAERRPAVRAPLVATPAAASLPMAAAA